MELETKERGQFQLNLFLNCFLDYVHFANLTTPMQLGVIVLNIIL